MISRGLQLEKRQDDSGPYVLEKASIYERIFYAISQHNLQYPQWIVYQDKKDGGLSKPQQKG